MENSLLTIFGEIWPKTMYYSAGTFVKFLKICKNSDFDWNQLKLSKQHKNTYMHLSECFLMKFHGHKTT